MTLTGRRNAATLAQFLLALAVITAAARAEDSPAAPKLQDDEMLVGPTSLADWFRDRTNPKTRDGFLADFDLNLKDVTAAFGECQLYLIEKKENRGGKWVFAGSRDNGFPKVTRAGKQSFVVKNRDGKEVSITLDEVKFFHGSVDNSQTPSLCDSTLNYSFKARGPFKLGGVVLGEHSATWWFLSELTYDISGKEIVKRKEKK